MSVYRDKDLIIRESYLALGDIAAQLVSAINKGNARTAKIRDLWSRGVKIRWLLKALSYEFMLSDVQINKFLACLVKQSKIRVFGAAPIIQLTNTKHLVLFTVGARGEAGTSGVPGDDANINVEPADGEVQIAVSEELESGVKTFNLSLNLYVEPSIDTRIDTDLLSGSQTNKRVREQGETVNTPLSITVTKGSIDVTASTFQVPTSLDAAYQALLDLPTINGVGSQIITMSDSGVVANQAYTVDVEDGQASPIPDDTDNLSFVYPFFFGASASILTQTTLYTQLTKLIETLGDKTVTLNDTSKYFYFGYPSSYGALDKILDGSGFVITSLWERVDTGGVRSPTEVFDVDSSALDNDWTHEYIVYRTNLITDIVDQDYKFIF